MREEEKQGRGVPALVVCRDCFSRGHPLASPFTAPSRSSFHCLFFPSALLDLLGPQHPFILKPPSHLFIVITTRPIVDTLTHLTLTWSKMRRPCWKRLSLLSFMLGLLQGLDAQTGPGPILSSQTIAILGDELYVHGGE